MKLDNRQSDLPKFLDRKIGILLVFLLSCIRPLLKLVQGLEPQGKKRFLIIKLSALGDVVVMLPALRLLKNQYPDSEIVFLGSSSNKEMCLSVPMISKFETFSIKNIFKLRKEFFTAVIDFDQWVRTTAIIAALMKTSFSVGFKSPSQYRHFAHDEIVEFSKNIHTGSNFWNLTKKLLTKLGNSVTSTFEEDCDKVQKEWLKTFTHKPTMKHLPENFIVIHPGCGENGVYRQWPIDSWKNLVIMLTQKFNPTEILITGQGDYEVALAQSISQAGGTSIAGKVSFQELIEILTRAKRVYSSNTGIMHLASFLGNRVIVLNGPTNSVLWKPLWGGLTLNSPVACAPCLTWGNDYGCSDPVCVKIMTPQLVFEASNA
ncbi:MAG: glycosyltransferase family 9 protein [Oligoflexia bacterium]|nr:glycosyltransferase family 9 protein [Oligoflexia bacterium]